MCILLLCSLLAPTVLLRLHEGWMDVCDWCLVSRTILVEGSQTADGPTRPLTAGPVLRLPDESRD